MLSLGDQIKRLRRERKLTQKQLADRLEVDQSTVSNYEQNRKLPDIHMLTKIAEFFNVTLDSLVTARNNSAHELTAEQKAVYKTVSDDNKITLEDLKNKFELIVDGRPATDQEIEDAMRYIAIQRRMKEGN